MLSCLIASHLAWGSPGTLSHYPLDLSGPLSLVLRPSRLLGGPGGARLLGCNGGVRLAGNWYSQHPALRLGTSLAVWLVDQVA